MRLLEMAEAVVGSVEEVGHLEVAEVGPVTAAVCLGHSWPVQGCSGLSSTGGAGADAFWVGERI